MWKSNTGAFKSILRRGMANHSDPTSEKSEIKHIFFPRQSLVWGSPYEFLKMWKRVLGILKSIQGNRGGNSESSQFLWLEWISNSFDREPPRTTYFNIISISQRRDLKFDFEWLEIDYWDFGSILKVRHQFENIEIYHTELKVVNVIVCWASFKCFSQFWEYGLNFRHYQIDFWGFDISFGGHKMNHDFKLNYYFKYWCRNFKINLWNVD